MKQNGLHTSLWGDLCMGSACFDGKFPCLDGESGFDEESPGSAPGLDGGLYGESPGLDEGS